MLGQNILARFNSTKLRFVPGIWYLTLPGRPYYIMVQFFQRVDQLSLFLERDVPEDTNDCGSQKDFEGEKRICKWVVKTCTINPG